MIEMFSYISIIAQQQVSDGVNSGVITSRDVRVGEEAAKITQEVNQL